MNESHEAFGIVKAATTSPARAELVVEIPETMRYRRLYGALYFFGGVTGGRASAEISMESLAGIGQSVSLRWEWGFPGTYLEVGNTPFRLPGKGDRNWWNLPPFSVQKIQPGEDTQWLQSSPLARDCMTAVVGDLDFPASFNVTMHPIPIISSASRIRGNITAEWTTDGGTFPDCGAYLLIGCRSSIIPVS